MPSLKRGSIVYPQLGYIRENKAFHLHLEDRGRFQLAEQRGESGDFADTKNSSAKAGIRGPGWVPGTARRLVSGAGTGEGRQEKKGRGTACL